MHRVPRKSFDALLVTALLLAGCGGGSAARPTATLAGTVTIADKPIAKGRVNFMPAGEGQSPPTSAEIVDGKYRVDNAPLGNVTVTFIATKQTGENNARGYQESVSIVPGKYAQGVTIEVLGDNESQDFKLEAQ